MYIQDAIEVPTKIFGNIDRNKRSKRQLEWLPPQLMMLQFLLLYQLPHNQYKLWKWKNNLVVNVGDMKYILDTQRKDLCVRWEEEG